MNSLFRLAILLVCTTLTFAANREVVLTSLEWPPYASEKLPAGGASSAVVRAAFAEMGYSVKIRFVPWSRAVAEAKAGKGVAGYFPEYESPDVRAAFTLSNPIGAGPLALAQRRDLRVEWQTIEDLSKWVVGTVQDYVNTPMFDLRVSKGLQLVDVAIDDSHNLAKLANRRVDLAIVDPYVFGWLTANDPLVKPVAGRLELNAKQIEVKNLYVCFRQDAAGKRLSEIFNAGLKRIDVAAIMRRYVPDYR